MRLALGTVQFGIPYGIANRTGQVNQADAALILGFAQAHGINMLDTAVAYGESEACLGECGTAGFEVVTKLPLFPVDCDDLNVWVFEQVSASLKRLNRSSLYGLLLHSTQQLLGPRGNELGRALAEMRDGGVVGKVGVSIYSPDELEGAMKVAPIDIVQAPFNLIDRRLERTGWLDRLSQCGVEVHARSAFLQGLLLMKKTELPECFLRWRGLFDDWNDWLGSYYDGPVAACLAYPLSFPQISRVVVGVDGIGQLADIVDAGRRVLNKGALGLNFPDLNCDDEDLINPSRWNSLESAS